MQGRNSPQEIVSEILTIIEGWNAPLSILQVLVDLHNAFLNRSISDTKKKFFQEKGLWDNKIEELYRLLYTDQMIEHDQKAAEKMLTKATTKWFKKKTESKSSGQESPEPPVKLTNSTHDVLTRLGLIPGPENLHALSPTIPSEPPQLNGTGFLVSLEMRDPQIAAPPEDSLGRLEALTLKPSFS